MKPIGTLFTKHLGAVCIVLCSIFIASPARANVTVGCAGATGGSFNFPTLTAALVANPAGNVEIDVSGTCTEAIIVAGVQNLSIVGTPGAALVDPGGSPPSFGAVLEIDNSTNVIVQGMSFQVAFRDVSNAIPAILVQSSDVRIVGTRLEGAGASDGIDMFQSTVRLIGATIIENNNDGLGDGEGVALFENSLLLLLSDSSGNCPLLQGNGDNGILAGNGGTIVRAPLGLGCATIQNNAFVGITGNLGATIELNVPQANPGRVKLLNNAFIGLVATNGSHFNLRGPVLIQGNAQDGIRLRVGAFGILGASDGTSGPTIQQNGITLAPVCCAPAAGISLANNSSVDLQTAQIANNAAPGVIAEDNSSVRIVGPTSITGNPIGVEVEEVSSTALFLAPTISGNSGGDVVCGPDSDAHGDLSAVGKINCPQFRPQVNAVAPRKHGKSPIP